jgi:3',5'-cyclic AMP phosphodiesterase CpdA
VESLSFGVIADVQYADKDAWGSRDFRAALPKLEACVANLNSRDLAFATQLGDLVDAEAKAFDAVLRALSRLRAPLHHVLGNHDFPLARDAVMRKLGLIDPYYSFTCRGWRFVMLDTAEISLEGGWPEDSPNYRLAQRRLEQLRAEGRAHAETWNGGIGPQQMEWLEATLAEASSRGEKAIVIGHIPVLAEASSDRHILYNHDGVAAVLDSAEAAVAYLAGHYHRGGYAQRSGVHHVTCPGMVEASERNAYAVVTLRDDRIEIGGVGDVAARVLRIGG